MNPINTFTLRAKGRTMWASQNVISDIFTIRVFVYSTAAT